MVVEAAHRGRVEGEGLWVHGEWVGLEGVGPAGEAVVNGEGVVDGKEPEWVEPEGVGPAGEEVVRGEEWAAKAVAVADGEEQAAVA